MVYYKSAPPSSKTLCDPCRKFFVIVFAAFKHIFWLPVFFSCFQVNFYAWFTFVLSEGKGFRYASYDNSLKYFSHDIMVVFSGSM